MWIQSCTALREHPKTRKLSRLLGVCRAQAIGHLHMLWWWAVEYAPTGNLAAYSPEEIASAADWTKDPNRFVRALQECGAGDAEGFVDANMAIHDWSEYAGRLLDKRTTDAARKRKSRGDGTGHPADVQRTSAGSPRDGAGRAQHSTAQHSTEQNSSSLTSNDGRAAACPAPAANGNSTGLSPVAIDHTIATYTAQGYTRSQVEEALVTVSARIAEGKVIRNLTAYVGTILQQEPTAAPTPEEPERRDNGCGAPPELIAERRAKRLAREREVFGE